MDRHVSWIGDVETNQSALKASPPRDFSFWVISRNLAVEREERTFHNARTRVRTVRECSIEHVDVHVARGRCHLSTRDVCVLA